MIQIIKLLICITFNLAWSITAVLAGDFAKRHIHGFSADGGLFAFEEYGVQDGSGFPYSNIYVIDTTTDRWTANSPYRVRLDDETKSVFDAREQARIMAGPVMKSFEDRGNIVATNRPTEISTDKKRVVVNPRLVVPPIDHPLEFHLKKLEFIPTELCESWGPSFGFELKQIATKNSETTHLIHKDQKIPSSRHCPLDYEFADVITYYPQNADPVVAILILMTQVGFEGPDGRYLAVTGKLQ